MFLFLIGVNHTCQSNNWQDAEMGNNTNIKDGTAACTTTYTATIKWLTLQADVRQQKRQQENKIVFHMWKERTLGHEPETHHHKNLEIQ